MADDRIPIIHLRDLLLVSIQVELTDRVVEQLKSDVTRAVETGRARGLILDLTGVDFMDSYISRALRDISVMTSLMGVPTILCGMHAAIAITMVEMGIELSGLRLALNLDAAVEMFDGGGASLRRDSRSDDVIVTEDKDDAERWVVG